MRLDRDRHPSNTTVKEVYDWADEIELPDAPPFVAVLETDAEHVAHKLAPPTEDEVAAAAALLTELDALG